MTSRAMTDLYGSLDHFIDGRDIDSVARGVNTLPQGFPNVAREPVGGQQCSAGRSSSLQPRVATEAKPAGSDNAAHVNAAGRSEFNLDACWTMVEGVELGEVRT